MCEEHSNWISTWMPLIVALVAGFLALYQVQQNNITSAKLKWLEELRKYIAAFVLRSYAYRISRTERNAKAVLDTDEALSSLYNIIFHLDPRDRAQQNLRILLESFYGDSKTGGSSDDLKELERKIKDQAGRVFTIEKEKASRQFTSWWYFKFGPGKKILREAEQMKNE